MIAAVTYLSLSVLVLLVALGAAYRSWLKEREVANMARGLALNERRASHNAHERIAQLRQRLEDIDPELERGRAALRCVEDLRLYLDPQPATPVVGRAREILSLHGFAQ